MVIYTLSILCLLSCWSCTKTELKLVPLGGERVVGKVEAGVVAWHADENPNGSYLVMTKGMVYKFAQALAKSIRLEQEVRILRAQLEKKDGE